MRVTVCIPANRSATIDAAIATIRNQAYTDWELVVVVHQAATAVLAAVDRSISKLPHGRLLTIPERGLSRARNAALQEAKGDIIAMIDDDCEASPDWLATLVACCDEDPQTGLVGGALLAPTVLGTLARCPALTPAEAIYDPVSGSGVPPGWDWIGANFAVRRWAAERVGGFDECLGAGADFPAGDDTDYKLRLEEHGVRMRSTPRARVRHTFGTRRGLPALLRMQRAYAEGNGALAGKLSLHGDPRGTEWLNRTRRQCVSSLRNPAAGRAPEALVRWVHYRAAFRRCVREYELDDRGLLRRRSAQRTGSSVVVR